MKFLSQRLNLINLVKQFRWLIGSTWLLLVIENSLMALIPLWIGRAIDGLLANNMHSLWQLCGILFFLVLIGVARRVYDTRVYSRIRVHLGMRADANNRQLEVSVRSARLDMSRELVDFLEQELPELFTAFIQIAVALIVLASFNWPLAVSALTASVAMLICYGFFHGRFHRLNGLLNSQTEQQVHLISKARPRLILGHLIRLRDFEIKISDTEALVYGLIFLFQISFVVFNLWFASQLVDISAGKIFTIVSYSWQFVEAALMLPISLQSWSRLSEITQRLNREGAT